MLLPTTALLLSIACAPERSQPDADCDVTVDSDGDGLDDCAEIELGTRADTADSDGDGSSDGDEADCNSDPLDANEQCYACGWNRNDPGNLAPTGAALGDTIENLVLVDQCSEEVALYDFSGSYSLAFMTAAWCPLCMESAGLLSETAATIARDTGQPVQGLIVLFQGNSGATPVAEDSAAYAERIDAIETPVLGDVNASALAAVPYNGQDLPGVCLLSPEMQIIDCVTGENDLTQFTDTINQHAE